MALIFSAKISFSSETKIVKGGTSEKSFEITFATLFLILFLLKSIFKVLVD